MDDRERTSCVDDIERASCVDDLERASCVDDLEDIVIIAGVDITSICGQCYVQIRIDQ